MHNPRLVELASEVRLVCIEERIDHRFPSTRALEYLSRHAIHAELVTLPPRKGGTITKEPVDYARPRRAGYLVIGAYSHGRAGEFLFGGFTRDMLG